MRPYAIMTVTESDVPIAAPVRHLCALLRERMERLETSTGLLLGCGSGDEVVYLRRAFKCPRVVGVDLSAAFSARARSESDLAVADAARLPFPANSFDFAAAIHSLEHVSSPRSALAEVARVLRPRGWFYVGVPNRTRVLGYLGSFGVSGWQKVCWNLIDYGQRLRGRFRNELGAHAGFDSRQLQEMLATYFSDFELLTEEYLRFKYAGRLPEAFLRLVLAPPVINYSVPAHYALCRKR